MFDSGPYQVRLKSVLRIFFKRGGIECKITIFFGGNKFLVGNFSRCVVCVENVVVRVLMERVLV